MRPSIGTMNTAVRARPALKELTPASSRTLNLDGSKSTTIEVLPHNVVDEISTTAFFNFDDPKIRVETYFFRETRFNIGVVCRGIAPNKHDEEPIGRLSLVKRGLRG